jgi:hypothetical protein
VSPPVREEPARPQGRQEARVQQQLNIRKTGILPGFAFAIGDIVSPWSV